MSDLKAIVPINSLVLGSFEDEFQAKTDDPLDYLYRNTFDFEKGDVFDLFRFYGFVKRGEKLKNYCEYSDTPNYFTKREYTQVKRSFISTLQFKGLDITTRAIGKYAKELNFSGEEYENLVNRLGNNYCSKNISVISIKSIKDNLRARFNLENDFSLPSIENSELFPKMLRDQEMTKDYLKSEFEATVELFKAFCSWGGNVENTRLLTYLLRNNIVSDFIVRQLSGVSVYYDYEYDKLLVRENNDTTKVNCKNLICRPQENINFNLYFPKTLGSASIETDLKNLYCSDFRYSQYKYSLNNDPIRSWLKDMTIFKENLLIGQFISLLTGIPDFFIRMKNEGEFLSIVRSGMDDVFNQWADGRLNDLKKDLYYEEILLIEKVDRNLYFRNNAGKFEIQLDVNLGEFDRLNQGVGKIPLKFDLSVHKKFLRWIRYEWKNLDPLDKKYKKFLFSKFQKTIGEELNRVEKKFKIKPWKGDLSKIIVHELLIQLDLYYGTYFNSNLESIIEIPIKLNYAPFALKYINHLHEIQNSRERSDNVLQSN